MTFAGKAKTELGQFQLMRLRLFSQFPVKLVQLFTMPLGRRLERHALWSNSLASVSRSRSKEARSSAMAC